MLKNKKVIFIVLFIIFFIIVSLLLVLQALHLFKNPLDTNITDYQVAIKENDEKLMNIVKASNEISQYFPNNISKIIVTNYFSNSTTSILEDADKIKEFTELFFSTAWKKEDSNYTPNAEISSTQPCCTIKFIGDTETSFDILDLPIVIIHKEEFSQKYTISESIHRNILAYTHTKYYLHKSELELPIQEKCYTAQFLSLEGLSEDSQNYIQTNFGYLHSKFESLLLDSVSLLIDKDSLYWSNFIEVGTLEESFLPESVVKNDGGFSKVLEQLNELTNEIQNEQCKNDLKKSCELLKAGINEQDVGKLFEAHTIIHDYDYFVFNYPVSFSITPLDLDGVQTYFGKVSIIE